MNLLIVASLCCIWMRSVFGDCHTGEMDDQWLGFMTSLDDTLGAGWGTLTGEQSTIFVYANIYTDGGWLTWRRLDNANCPDFVAGQIDYFDDFSAYTSKWEAIALYSCHTNAWLIETIYYWDGSAQQIVQTWDPRVFGPFPQNCVYCNGAVCGSDDAYDIRLDNDYCPCAGVVFSTPASGSEKGTVWSGAAIGPPACGAEVGAIVPFPENPDPVNVVNDSMNEFAERLLNYLMITIAMAVILVISALCLVAVVFKNKGSVKFSDYGKVDVEQD
eukprot:UN00451